MSAAKVGQASDFTNKWELAQRISGHAKAPEQALQSVFTGAMENLEEISKTTFESSMKERVWSSVSEAKLKNLKEAFILEFCEKILGSFSNEEAGTMLEENKKLGAVKNILYSSRLQVAFALQQKSIIEAVVKKADSMTEEWIPEIVAAVKKEGIKLPDPK
jgi:hypothetical protein